MAVKVTALTEFALQPLGKFNGFAIAGHILENDRELIAAQPGDHRSLCWCALAGQFAYAILKSLSNDRQQSIACSMPEAVVDDFETIKIDKQHCETIPLA